MQAIKSQSESLRKDIKDQSESLRKDIKDQNELIRQSQVVTLIAQAETSTTMLEALKALSSNETLPESKLFDSLKETLGTILYAFKVLYKNEQLPEAQLLHSLKEKLEKKLKMMDEIMKAKQSKTVPSILCI